MTRAEKISLSWKNPVIRAARLKHRSENKSWMASRHKCAVTAAKALHTEHKNTYLAGQVRHGETMKRRFSDPKFKNKHLKAVIKASVNPQRRKRISKSHRLGRRNGTINHRFWEHANKSNGPSLKELKIVKALDASGLVHIHQFPVPSTCYVADICFPVNKLIVEVDGHPSHYTKEGKARMRKRDRKLRSLGFSVMHLSQRILDKRPSVSVTRIKSMLQRCA